MKYVKASGLIYVKARLKMKTTAEGGRKTGFISGYSPNHVFEHHEGQMLRTYIGDIVFEGQDAIMPGEEKIVTVRFLMTPTIGKYLSVGRNWRVQEAATVLGEAEIISIDPEIK
jgi:hypothetical protein